MAILWITDEKELVLLLLILLEIKYDKFKAIRFN